MSSLHIQTRLMGNFGLNGGIPWLCNTDGVICFLCKVDIETVNHFLLDCPNFQEHFDSLWANLTIKVTKSNDIDERQISAFIVKFLQDKKKYRIIFARLLKRRAKISADISARLFMVTCNKVSSILIHKD